MVIKYSLFFLFLFFISYLLTRWLSLSQLRTFLLDQPNHRSLHSKPTPRTGGIAIFLALGLLFLVGKVINPIRESLFFPFSKVSWIVAATLLISAVSLWDDRSHVPPVVRICIHTLATLGIVFGAGYQIPSLSLPLVGTVELGWVSAPLTLLGLLWVTNLYNFMDGLDGLAGGMSVCGFGILGVIAWTKGSPTLAFSSLLIASAAGGFLVHNLPPARIFMGDMGSVTLGFLAGVVSLAGIHLGLFDLWVPALVFSPFLVDATVTLVRRLYKKESVLQAHRQHFYQRLVLAGWSVKKTLRAEFVLMIACGLSAAIYTISTEFQRLLILMVWVLIYSFLAAGVRILEKKSGNQKKREFSYSAKKYVM